MVAEILHFVLPFGGFQRYDGMMTCDFELDFNLRGGILQRSFAGFFQRSCGGESEKTEIFSKKRRVLSQVVCLQKICVEVMHRGQATSTGREFSEILRRMSAFCRKNDSPRRFPSAMKKVVNRFPIECCLQKETGARS